MNLKLLFFLVMFLLTFTQISMAQRVVKELGNEWKFAKDSNEKAFLPELNDTGLLTTLKIQLT